jgi:hypothetical protein
MPTAAVWCDSKLSHVLRRTVLILRSLAQELDERRSYLPLGDRTARRHASDNSRRNRVAGDAVLIAPVSTQIPRYQRI